MSTFQPASVAIGVSSASDQGCSNSSNLWLVLTHSLSPHRDNGRSTSLVASVFISISTFNDDDDQEVVKADAHLCRLVGACVGASFNRAEIKRLNDSYTQYS